MIQIVFEFNTKAEEETLSSSNLGCLLLCSAQKMEIRNCRKSAREAIQFHPFGTSAERSKAQVTKGSNFIIPQARIQELHILVLFYCLTLEKSLIQVPSEVRHAC